MQTQTTIVTIDTRQYTEEAGQIANARARQQRAEELADYGKRRFVLTSTIVVPLHDGIIIIDTLSRIEDY